MTFFINRTPGGPQRPAGPHTTWSGDATKNMGVDIYNQQVTINVGDDAMTDKTNVEPAKERPKWLTESTVEGAIIEPTQGESSSGLPLVQIKWRTKRLMKKLCVPCLHMKVITGGATTQVVIPEEKSDESDASASDDEYPSTSTVPITNDSTVQMDSGDEDEEDEEVMVMVGGQLIPFQDVTDEQVAQMSHAEKESTSSWDKKLMLLCMIK